VHFSDGLLQPTHTPFLIAMPHVLHGSHPQVWHIETSLIPDYADCLLAQAKLLGD